MFKKIIKIAVSFSKLERYIFLGALVIFAVAAMFWLINFYDDVTRLAPQRGGHYTEGIVGQPTSLNPLIAGATDADRDLLELFFDDLYELADKIEVSDDKETWIVTLKSGLYWSDGEPLTTADVSFTLETIQNPDTQSPAFSTWQGVVAQRVSDREIHFSLKNPYVFFVDNLRNLKIAPRHIFGNVPPSNLRLSNYNLEPVGSGPYKFISLEKEKSGFIREYLLDTNDYYGGNRPFIETFKVVFFASENAAIQSFNRRDIDGLGGLSPQRLDDLKIGHQTLNINMPRYYAIFINQSTNPALKERAVRLALAAATDKAEVVSTIFDNQAIAVDGPIPTIVDGYSSDINNGGQVLEDIKSSLDRAGWKLNEDGIREKTIDKRQVKLEFVLQIPQVDFLIEASEIIAAQWAEVGVKINTIILSATEVNDVIRNRNYSLLLFGNTLRGNPDIFSFWHSSERFYPGLNLSIYNNKSVDSLLEGIRQDFNVESRKNKIVRLQELIRQDQPAIFLFSPNYIYVANKDLSGFSPSIMVLASDRFKNVESWFLKTSRVLKK
ncbi:MAG: peptide ABC transporter substrate-binding protein [bacterium]|nr:peptide ABC transporter substrate-binding protein [bacterium]